MKNVFSVLLIISVLFALSGCAGRSDSLTADKKTVSSRISSQTHMDNQTKSEESKESIPNEKIFTINTAEDFSDGVAWVKVSSSNEDENSVNYRSCIDQDGKVLFSFHEDEINSVTPFENGVSYITTSSGVNKVINKKGETVISSKNNFFDKIVAYGDGLFSVNKYVVDFDHSEFQVGILDKDGNWKLELTSLASNVSGMNYFGDGIFGYMVSQTASLGSADWNFYNTKTESWFNAKDITGLNQLVLSTYNNPNPCRNIFQNGIALVEIGNGRMGDKAALLYTDGTLKELNINTEHAFYDYGPISDGGFVYSAYDDVVISVSFYDMKKHVSISIDNYADKIPISSLSKLYYKNDHMLLKLTGSDSKNYYTILDKAGKALMKPQLYESMGELQCDRIVWRDFNGFHITDQKGKEIFQKTDCNSISDYSENFAIINENNYINLKGEELFQNKIIPNFPELT